jgi:hypothetical protein
MTLLVGRAQVLPAGSERPGKGHPRRQHGEADAGERMAQQSIDNSIIDESLEDSFPASDPPSWTISARVGAPSRRSSDERRTRLAGVNTEGR